MSEDEVKQFLLSEMVKCNKEHENLAEKKDKKYLQEYFFMVLKDMY
jgi:hypothetical protein